MYQEQQYIYEQTGTNFMYKVYGWMSFALAITAVTAWYVAATPIFYNAIMERPFLLILIFIGQLVLVITLTALLPKLNLMTAVGLFLLYAVSLGFTISLVFRIYTMASIASTFIVTSGMFGGMSLYGYFTKSDLTRTRNLSIMILWGLILALLVNMFLQSPLFDYIISFVGVVVFTLLSAADTQKIKELGRQLVADEQTRGKVAVLGALMLYLDFINLFLYLLRFMGNRRK